MAHGNTSVACVGGGMGWKSVPGDWVGVEGVGRFPLQDITKIKNLLLIASTGGPLFLSPK